MANNRRGTSKRGWGATTSRTNFPEISSEEHVQKRRKIERGFRKAIGHPVSDHESDESDSDDSSSSSSSNDDPNIPRARGGISEDGEEDEEDWENILDTTTKEQSKHPLSKPSEKLNAEGGDLILTLDREYVPSIPSLYVGIALKKTILWPANVAF
ncbi:hypothetical protein ABW20_dc0104916 [Dactylellina cionopaga]|nr:hypothetical protein ABW20_dc0104916 [Dactylellina cionopaga]